MEEEPSELERLCLEVRAQLEALSDDDDDVDASSTDTDEECIMAADHHYPQEASHDRGAETRLDGAAANDGQEYASSSRMSSGTLYNASGSYELAFLAAARPSGNVTHEMSRCCYLRADSPALTHSLPHICTIFLSEVSNVHCAHLLHCGRGFHIGPSYRDVAEGSSDSDGLQRVSGTCRTYSMDPSQLLHAHSGRSGEDLLFDLDEERHCHGALSSMAAEPTTPSAGQVSIDMSCVQRAGHSISCLAHPLQLCRRMATLVPIEVEVRFVRATRVSFLSHRCELKREHMDSDGCCTCAACGDGLQVPAHALHALARGLLLGRGGALAVLLAPAPGRLRHRLPQGAD